MIRKIREKIGVNWLFLISVCLLYLVICVFNTQIALAGLLAFLQLLRRILPILAIVFGLLFLSNLLLDKNLVIRYLGKGARKAGWLIVIITGIISAGPIYLWYPLLSDLKENGMREALIATFLYNRAVKIPLLPMMVFYFGFKLVAILSIYTIVFSVLNGYIVERILIKGGKKQ